MILFIIYIYSMAQHTYIIKYYLNDKNLKLVVKTSIKYAMHTFSGRNKK